MLLELEKKQKPTSQIPLAEFERLGLPPLRPETIARWRAIVRDYLEFRRAANKQCLTSSRNERWRDNGSRRRVKRFTAAICWTIDETGEIHPPNGGQGLPDNVTTKDTPRVLIPARPGFIGLPRNPNKPKPEKRITRLVEDSSGKKRRKTTQAVSSNQSARRLATLSFEFMLNWHAQTICRRMTAAKRDRIGSCLVARKINQIAEKEVADTAIWGDWYVLKKHKSGHKYRSKCSPRNILRLKSLATDGPEFRAVDSAKLRSLIGERGYIILGETIQNPGANSVISTEFADIAEFTQSPRVHHGEYPREGTTWNGRPMEVFTRASGTGEAITELARLIAIRFFCFGRGQRDSEIPRDCTLCADAVLRGDALDRCALDIGIPRETFRRWYVGLKHDPLARERFTT